MNSVNNVSNETKDNYFNKIEKNENIKMTDSNDDLKVFCYLNCDQNSDDFVKETRGVVFDIDNQIVMKSFSYTNECSENDKELLKQKIENVFDNSLFYNSYEGSIIRMFCYKDKWYISTHKKLDAFKSKWGSNLSFGTCFKNAIESELESNSELKKSLNNAKGKTCLDRFKSTLDKKKQYMFLVCNNSHNRLVCDPPNVPKLFHVGTFYNGELSMDENINIPYPEKLNFKNLDEVFEYVSNVDYKSSQGVIVFCPNNVQYKIYNNKYKYYFDVRGNESSVKYRYLQIRMNMQLNRDLHFLYPEYNDWFNNVENNIYDIAKYLYNSYVERFIRKNRVNVPKEQYIVIKLCHSWHIQDRNKNKINLEKVIETINELKPNVLNYILKKYNYNLKK